MAESNADAPSPLSAVPDECRDVLQRQNVETLEAISRYAQALADAQREEETTAERDQTEDHTNEDSNATPEEVPSNASAVTKTINGYDYYYWQWRDGETIKSKYKAPVNPKR